MLIWAVLSIEYLNAAQNLYFNTVTFCIREFTKVQVKIRPIQIHLKIQIGFSFCFLLLFCLNFSLFLYFLFFISLKRVGRKIIVL